MTDQDLAILDLERRWWHLPGAKETAIVERTGLSPVRYYQRLTALIGTEAALAHDPVLVNRLRRIADTRATGRRRRAA